MKSHTQFPGRPQKDERWPHDMWEQMAMEHVDQDHRNRRSNYVSLHPAPALPHGTELNRAKQYANYRKFVFATVECIRRCVIRVTNNRGGVPLAVKDLPDQFEAQWGTTFDQDSLSLRDMQDLIDFLDLLPGSFVLARTTASTNPTIKCRPVGHGIQLIDEYLVRTLWMRLHERKPKSFAGCIELYKQIKEAAGRAKREVWSQVASQVLHASGDSVLAPEPALNICPWCQRETEMKLTRTQRICIRCCAYSPRPAARGHGRKQRGEALQGSSSKRGILGESRGVSRWGGPNEKPKQWEADATAIAAAQHTVHQSKCGCPACTAERAAPAHSFIPSTCPKEVKSRKRREVIPRGSIAMVLRKIPKTSTPSSLPSSQDLFERAETLLGQEVGTLRDPDTSTDPRSSDVYQTDPRSSGVYQGTQSLALIPGAPAFPVEGYPPPPLPSLSV